MFERFTEAGRGTVVAAQQQARALGHNYVGTEHLLLGLLAQDGDTVAKKVLSTLDLALDDVRQAVVRIVGRGDDPVQGQIPLTPRAKDTLELATQEAIALGSNWSANPEHILLALVDEGEGVGARILGDFDIDQQRLRTEVAVVFEVDELPEAPQIGRRHSPEHLEMAVGNDSHILRRLVGVVVAQSAVILVLVYVVVRS